MKHLSLLESSSQKGTVLRVSVSSKPVVGGHDHGRSEHSIHCTCCCLDSLALYYKFWEPLLCIGVGPFFPGENCKSKVDEVITAAIVLVLKAVTYTLVPFLCYLF